MKLDMTCPKCGKEHDAHTNPYDKSAVPQDGDASICISCGSLGIFEGKGLRLPSLEEAKELMQDKEIVKALVVWKLMDIKRRAH